MTPRSFKASSWEDISDHVTHYGNHYEAYPSEKYATVKLAL